MFRRVLRVVAVAALAIGLARPETYRTVKHEVDTIDIMLVVDMSKSMEETDMARDRLDAAQRVIRRFLRRNTNDRVGLVIFGQQAMLACPLTQDTKLLEQIVSDLAIGDVPAARHRDRRRARARPRAAAPLRRQEQGRDPALRR